MVSRDIPSVDALIPYVSWVLDDAGSAVDADEVSIARAQAHQHWLVVYQCGFEPLVVMVHSYLGADLDCDEAIDLARDWLLERGWFAGRDTEPDYVLSIPRPSAIDK